MLTLAHMRHFNFLTSLLVLFTVFCKAQGSIADSSISMTFVIPGYSLQVPAGDLKNRFGINSNISLNVIYKNKHRWFTDVQGSFIFGSKVKQEGLFSHLITSQGDIIGTDGRVADVRVFERGYYITAGLGKMFAARKPNPNSGFFISAGAGYLQHKIKIQDKNGVVPALQSDYKRGYDRLCSGLCLRQSAGYIYISKRRLFNFYFALECIEAFTKGRRNFEFDDEKADTEKRTDVLSGFRIGWALPLYKAAPESYYLY